MAREEKTITELTNLPSVNRSEDLILVVDVSDTTDSEYGSSKKTLVSEFIGDKGDAATVDVGTTTTGAAGTSASVTNVGTTSAAVFNFTIPKGDKGACVESVAFVGNDIVFTLEDDTTVTLTNAKIELKGDKGDTGAKIVSGAFVGDNLVFTLDDASTVTVINAKVDLKGDTGEGVVAGGTTGQVLKKKSDTDYDTEWQNDNDTTYTAGDGLLLTGTSFSNTDKGSSAVSTHESAFVHSDIAHSNRTALDAVSGTNTGDQDLSPYAIDEDVKKFTGFENRTDSTIAMDEADFTITTLSSYHVWINSIGKIEVTTPFSIGITADQDLTYVYFDYFEGALRINASTTPWDIKSGHNIPVAIAYKDGDTYALTDERHGYNRNLEWHNWAHNNIGAMYFNGLAGTFTDTTLSVTQGIIYDEDIRFDTGGTKTTASLWYRNATDGMRLIRGSTTPYRDVNGDGTGSLQYDDGSGTLASVGNNRYSTQWVYGSNDAAEPIYVVIGQNNDVTLAAARNATQPIINLSTAEWKLLYRVIYQNSSNTPKYIEAADFRNVQTGVPTTVVTPTSHSILTDRDAAGSHPATAISNTPAGNIEATTVQAAINELDTEKANTALSNLAGVAINTSLVSDTDNTDDLGTTLKKWANLFVTTIGATATRVTKGWFTDLEVTNAIVGSITGNAVTATAAAAQAITDNAIATVDDLDAAANDYAKFTESGLEGRSYAEVKQDLDLEIGTDVAAQTHAAQHAVSGPDTVFPADPNADRYLMWDDDPGALVWAEVAGGTDEKVKYDVDDPTAGYIADKIIAGTGISVAEGTGGDSNKLVITSSAAAAHPVGSIITIKGDSTNPATLLGYGTWVAADLDVICAETDDTYYVWERTV